MTPFLLFEYGMALSGAIVVCALGLAVSAALILIMIGSNAKRRNVR